MEVLAAVKAIAEEAVDARISEKELSIMIPEEVHQWLLHASWIILIAAAFQKKTSLGSLSAPACTAHFRSQGSP